MLSRGRATPGPRPSVTAIAWDLGYFPSIWVFAAAMAVVLVAWRVALALRPAAATAIEVVAFWAAYVLTRPLGASIADWLGKPAEKGHGLGWGDGWVTLGALVMIIALVAWLARTGHGVQDEMDAVRD